MWEIFFLSKHASPTEVILLLHGLYKLCTHKREHCTDHALFFRCVQLDTRHLSSLSISPQLALAHSTREAIDCEYTSLLSLSLDNTFDNLVFLSDEYP